MLSRVRFAAQPVLKQGLLSTPSAPLSTAMGGITEDEAKGMLRTWGDALVGIAKCHREGGDYTAMASEVIDVAYNYDKGTVLFKPTLAFGDSTFRGDKEGCLSYFVGGNPKYPKDGGFAIKPWAEADFYIAGIITGETQAMAMGNKLLKDTDGNLTVANFTFGYIRDPDTGGLKINVHHSSLPFEP